MYDFLIAKADPRLKFCPVLSDLKAHIAMIKTSDVPKEIRRTCLGSFVDVGHDGGSHHRRVLRLTAQALRCANELQSHVAGNVRHHILLDELDRGILCMLSGNSCKFVPHSWSKMKGAFLREQLVKLGLVDYFRSKLDSEPDFLGNIGTLHALWYISLDPTESIPVYRGPGTDSVVHLPQNRGIDPNKENDYDGNSPWNGILAQVCDWWTSRQPRGRHSTRVLSFLLDKGILKLFLKAGKP